VTQIFRRAIPVTETQFHGPIRRSAQAATEGRRS
jgi:hypothetical protein